MASLFLDTGGPRKLHVERGSRLDSHSQFSLWEPVPTMAVSTGLGSFPQPILSFKTGTIPK